MSRTTPVVDHDLDLPDLDGGHDGDAELEADGAFELDDLGDDCASLEDATSEDEPFDLAVEGTEDGWLDGAEDAAQLDVGTFDFSLPDEALSASDDEPSEVGAFDELAALPDALPPVDLGEEGPLDEDEELSAEDLPALDADEEGELAVEGLYDENLMASEEELRWDDRAWERASERPAAMPDEGEDSWAHAGHDPSSARDVRWKRLEETGRVTAAAFVPGDAVVLAMNERSRVVLVRIAPDGVARIIAEIEGENDMDDVDVTTLRWDDATACIVAVGSSGTQAFRPAREQGRSQS